MAKFTEIHADLWEDMIDLPIPQKLAYIYLFSNASCRPSGLYKISFKTIQLFTGATEGDINALCPRWIFYDKETQEVWIKGRLKRNHNASPKNHNLYKNILTDLRYVESEDIRKGFIKKYNNYFEENLTTPVERKEVRDYQESPKSLPRVSEVSSKTPLRCGAVQLKDRGTGLQEGKGSVRGKGDPKSKTRTDLTDEEWIETLRGSVAFKGVLDLDVEFGKMDNWLTLNPGRKKTRTFVLRWLNREADRRREVNIGSNKKDGRKPNAGQGKYGHLSQEA